MAILEGLVFHRRAEQSINEFTYRVQYTLVSLDHPPKGFAGDHITADQARAQAGTRGPVYLLTTPTSAGYTQNPISVYYCYDDLKDARLTRCIAEVSYPDPPPSPSQNFQNCKHRMLIASCFAPFSLLLPSQYCTRTRTPSATPTLSPKLLLRGLEYWIR
jgi:hypothetical protein